MRPLLTLILGWVLVLSCSAATLGFRAPTATVNYGLLGWWTFNEGSGETLLDHSGNAYHAITTNSPSWVSGAVGGGLEFNGTSSCAAVSTNLFGTDAMSVSVWFYPKLTASAYSTILGPDESVHSGIVSVLYKSNNKLAVYVRVVKPTITYASYDGTGATVSTNTWHHLVAAYDNVSGLKAYLDGVLDGSAAANGTITNDNKFWIGAQPQSSGLSRFFKGGIDEVRVYNRALALPEMKLLYGGGYGCQ